METKTLEDMLSQVYDLGVQQADCDLTKRANTIMMLANQRVIEELEKVISNLDSPWDRDTVRRQIKQLKRERDA